MLLARRNRGDPHGWNSLDHYLAIYHRCMDDLGPFIEHNGLAYTPTPEVVSWEGRIRCQGGIELTVSKAQEVEIPQNGQARVRTTSYSYHATRRRGSRVVNLLRYDNIHAHNGHPDAHHLHRFDDDGNETEVVHVGYDGWPVLSQVLEELRDRFNAKGA